MPCVDAMRSSRHPFSSKPRLSVIVSALVILKLLLRCCVEKDQTNRFFPLWKKLGSGWSRAVRTLQADSEGSLVWRALVVTTNLTLDTPTLKPARHWRVSSGIGE